MLSIPVLIAYLVVITIYLIGCEIIHLRDIHDDKRSDQDGGSQGSAPRHGGAHEIRL
jgi:hypothetical protein